MRKRGQSSEAIKYLIIAAVIIATSTFGFMAISKVNDKFCDIGIGKLKISLQDLSGTVKPGAAKEFSLEVPCDIEKLYFFDVDKNIDLSVLPNLPLLKESISSGARNNLFLIKENTVVDSMYVGNLDLTYPNYVCLIPRNEKIHFFLEGKAGKASVVPACTQPECTFIPVDQIDETAVAILREAKSHGETTHCENCPRHVTTDYARFVQTRENIQITRKYEYCRETGITNVEIKVVPKGKAEMTRFIYYEFIPKDCMEDLYNYLTSTFDEDSVDVRADPLIMWRLDSLKDEQKITYAVEKLLSDECKQAIEGIGVAASIDNGRTVAVPEIPAVETVGGGSIRNSPPELGIPNKELLAHEDTIQVVFPDITRFARDKETNRAQLGYSIVDQSNTRNVDCSIQHNKILSCIVKKNEHSLSDITVEVFDGQHTVADTFRLRVKGYVKPPTCGDGTCAASETCDTCALDCGECTIEGQKRLKCGEVLPQLFCQNEVFCPGDSVLYGGVDVCECTFNCKKQFRCVELVDVTSCELNPQCDDDQVVLGEAPC